MTSDKPWTVADAAGHPVRVTRHNGAELFRASDIARAAGICFRRGGLLQGVSADDAFWLPRAAVGLPPGRPVPFVTALGFRAIVRRSNAPSALTVEAWLWTEHLVPAARRDTRLSHAD